MGIFITKASLLGASIDLTSEVNGSLPMANLDLVTVANGGTGLISLGTGLQHLRVNAGATALEYADPPISLTPRGIFFNGIEANDIELVQYAPINITSNKSSFFMGGTETTFDKVINFAFRVTRNYSLVTINSSDGASTLAFRDDGVSIGALTIASSTTGDTDSGALTDDVASGSLINYIIDRSASTVGGLTHTMHTEYSIV